MLFNINISKILKIITSVVLVIFALMNVEGIFMILLLLMLALIGIIVSGYVLIYIIGLLIFCITAGGGVIGLFYLFSILLG